MGKKLEINLNDNDNKKSKSLEIDITDKEEIAEEINNEEIDNEENTEEENIEEEDTEEEVDESKLYNNEFVSSPIETEEEKEELKNIMTRRRNSRQRNRPINVVTKNTNKNNTDTVKVVNNDAPINYEEMKRKLDELKEDNTMKKNIDINLNDEVKKENKVVEEEEIVNAADYEEAEEEVEIVDASEYEEAEEEEGIINAAEYDEAKAKENKELKKNFVSKDENDAKGFISGLLAFLTGGSFKKKIAEKSKETGLSERKLADSFFKRILGTLSDVFHLAIDTINDLYSTTICLLSGLLLSTGDLIVRCAKRLVRIVTLNSTCKA